MTRVEIDAVNKAATALGLGLAGMTQERWSAMSALERAAIIDLSGLSPQLTGKDGMRVEATTLEGAVRRFWVGLSSGWRPVHIEIKRRDSVGGEPADKSYRTVRIIYAAGMKT